MVNVRFYPDSLADSDALTVFLILFPGGVSIGGGLDGPTRGGAILQENAFVILQENGDDILQEQN